MRTASTPDIEGRNAATIVAKWDVKRVATIAPDYAYGRDIMHAFAELLKLIAPRPGLAHTCKAFRPHPHQLAQFEQTKSLGSVCGGRPRGTREVAHEWKFKYQISCQHMQMPVLWVMIKNRQLGHQRIKCDCTTVVARNQGRASFGEILNSSNFEAEPFLR